MLGVLDMNQPRRFMADPVSCAPVFGPLSFCETGVRMRALTPSFRFIYRVPPSVPRRFLRRLGARRMLEKGQR